MHRPHYGVNKNEQESVARAVPRLCPPSASGASPGRASRPATVDTVTEPTRIGAGSRVGLLLPLGARQLGARQVGDHPSTPGAVTGPRKGGGRHPHATGAVVDEAAVVGAERPRRTTAHTEQPGGLGQGVEQRGGGVHHVTVDPRAPRLPGRVARALVLAADQAIVNAVEHADAVGLYVDVSADDRRVIVRVVDAGTGFDVQAVPEDRLGISGSIVARTAAVGGQALVRSSRRGTVAELRWEYPR